MAPADSPGSALPPAVPYRAAVLLSAYGRSPFLGEQLASIRAALAPDDILIVVDDGSRQVDWKVLGDWPTHYLCWSRLQGLGSAVSFMELLLDVPVHARYYCWADQDDVWQADKLHRQLQALESMPGAWACVHGWRERRLRPNGARARDIAQAPVVQRSRAHYCFETPAPGMTLCMTEAARQLLRSLDAGLRARLLAAMPHDRLVCAVLGAYGRLHTMVDALVDYRQHPHNQIGAPRAGAWSRSLRRLRQGFRIWRTMRAGVVLYRQLAESGVREGHPLPALERQPLRSNTWESWALQIWARWQG